MDLFHSLEFKSQVEELMKQRHVPGLSIAIISNDETSSAGFGSASLESSTPCTPDTLFDIASSAKLFTAAAVALLVDDDETYPEVQYDALMSHLLPEDFVMPGTGYTEGVMVEDVLSHRTGMAGHDSSYMGTRAAQPDDARSVTRNLRNLSVASPLRSRYMYCNMMFTVATHLVEVKTQRSFSDFLHERFFEPLGMRSTHLQPKSAREKGLGERMATGYAWNQGTYQGFDSHDCPEGQGAGSIISSANDFIKWVKALVNRENPITEKVYQGLTQTRSIVNPSGRRLKPHTSPVMYAAGLDVYYYRGKMVVGHEGGIPTFGSKFLFLPELKFGVVVLGNSFGAGPVSTTVTRMLMEEVLQVPEAERQYQNKSKNAGGAPKKDFPIHVKKQPQNQADSHSNDHQPSPSADRPPDPSSSGNSDKSKAKRENKNKNKDKTKDAAKVKSNTPKKSQQGRQAKPSPPQETPLDAYTGDYQHPGYHTVTVEIKDCKLFIDATDRSMAFTLTFEHVESQTKYIAHLSDFWEGGDDPVDAEFVFQGGRAIRLGLDLEPAVKKMIWFNYKPKV